MSRDRRRPQYWSRIGVAAALLLALACSTDSPTAPTQTGAPTGGVAPSAAWSISVELSPEELQRGAQDPTTVTVRVTNASTGEAPPQGTTIVVSTTLGDFVAPASGLSAVALSLANGRGQVALFAGTQIGAALVTARLEQSAGQATLQIREVIEPIVASFNFANSQPNFSVTFQDTSTGDPTAWLWEFGDGARSREQNPSHVYDGPGDYVVVLTASKESSEDTTSQIVTVQIVEPEDLTASFVFTVNNLTAVFQDTSQGSPTSWFWDFGDGTTSAERNPTHTYAVSGSYVVTLTVSNAVASANVTATVTVSEPVFITDISPGTGTAAGGTFVTISGTGFVPPLQVFFAGILADVLSVSPGTITLITPAGPLGVEACDAGGVPGVKKAALAVDVRLQLSSGASQTVSGGYVYTVDPGDPNPCVPTEVP